MTALSALLRHNPIAARTVPFLAFLLLTLAQPLFSGTTVFWLYLLKTLVGGWLLWIARNVLTELRWVFSWEAVAIGIGVFAMWVGVDPFYPKLNMTGPAWNPRAAFGPDTVAAWFFIVVRMAGSSLLVPMLEEVFYRSFIYRYLAKVEFLTVPLSHFSWRPFVITSLIFGFEHSQWLAGILCGFAYQGLVCWKGRLGDAMTAHALTNFLLGVWVVWKGAWQFW